MICPSLELIAAAAAGSDDADAVAVLVHAATCPRCAALVTEQRDVRALARRMSSPSLDRDRRAELAAEVMALADAAPRDQRNRRIAIGASIAIAVAATIAIVLAMRSMGESQVAVAPPAPRAPERRAPPAPAPTPAPSPAPTPIAEPVIELAAGTRATRTVGDTELVELADGNVTVDTQASRDVAITAGTTRVAVGRARATVVAQHGVIRQVQVFAGSVEVIASGKKQVVTAGAIWRATEVLPAPTPEPTEPTMPPAPPKPAAPQKPAADVSLQAFREGYVALRAGRNADAMAAFDRATDPVVAEDAMFWGAVASDRFGDKDDALRRYTAFLASYPTSPRAGDAKAAIAKLGR